MSEKRVKREGTYNIENSSYPPSTQVDFIFIFIKNYPHYANMRPERARSAHSIGQRPMYKAFSIFAL